MSNSPAEAPLTSGGEWFRQQQPKIDERAETEQTLTYGEWLAAQPDEYIQRVQDAALRLAQFRVDL